MAQKRNRFEFLDEIATADAAYHAYGPTLIELFESAALALFATMVELDQIGCDESVQVSVAGDDYVELLYNWLAELVYLKDVHGHLYSKFDVTISDQPPYQLNANAHGSSIASVSDATSCDVKAVTYHRLAIEKTDHGFKATVILDL